MLGESFKEQGLKSPQEQRGLPDALPKLEKKTPRRAKQNLSQAFSASNLSQSPD